MTQQQTELVERLRVLLAEEPSTREVPMFGCRSFMVNDKMIASALADGDLLVGSLRSEMANSSSSPEPHRRRWEPAGPWGQAG